MFIDYISHLENLNDACESFEKSITYIFFDSGQLKKTMPRNYCNTVIYQKYFAPLKLCVELIKVLRPRSVTPTFIDEIAHSIADLDDSKSNYTLEKWNISYKNVKAHLALVEIEMRSTFFSFDSEERERINEAMHTGLEGCNYSCVAMSVSAVESRLYKLMTLVKPDSTSNLNNMTLGQLIKEYSENEVSYQNIVLDKHDALLALCNTYRIFSVHPKREHVSGGIATSILNLSMAFLSDPDSTPESVKTKLATK